MPKVKTSNVSKILLVACGTLIVLLGSELLLRAFNVDLRLLRKTLYYQTACLSLHRTSSDAQRLFELAPNIPRGMWEVTPFGGTKYSDKIDASINALGFRGKSFSPTKKPGVFRIVIFGGSNTFGATVNDEGTYPAQMQKIFDEKYPGKIEVWNAGVSAYEMSQDVAYAETVMKKFDPDLLIFQDTNRGRRAFHANVTLNELKELFGKNNELFFENIPRFWKPEVPAAEKVRFFLVSKGDKIYNSLVSMSALFRTFCVSLHTCLGAFLNNSLIAPTTNKNYGFFGYNGQMISDRELNLFTERHKDKKIILFFLTDFAKENCLNGVVMRRNMEDFVLDTKGKPPEYQEVHPPSYVYVWYAREFCDFLVRKGYVPLNDSNR